MANLTFTNSKISDAIVGETQAFRAHITSAGVCETGTLAAEVAANLKDSAAYVGTIFKEATLVAKQHLQAGERVTLDGICRLEIQAEGSSASEDEPWNPEKHRLVVKAIPYDALKFAAAGLIPENTLKPVQIQLLGAQDEMTLEQNVVHKGNVMLVQGRGLRLTSANEEEGLFLVGKDDEYKLNVTASTAGTIDATVPTTVPAGVYTLEIRGRDGNGKNRMIVSSVIRNFEVKEV